jgi:hypothetical protein
LPSVSAVRIRRPYLWSVSVVRLRRPYPLSVSAVRIRRPYLPSVSVVRVRRPYPPSVSAVGLRSRNGDALRPTGLGASAASRSSMPQLVGGISLLFVCVCMPHPCDVCGSYRPHFGSWPPKKKLFVCVCVCVCVCVFDLRQKALRHNWLAVFLVRFLRGEGLQVETSMVSVKAHLFFRGECLGVDAGIQAFFLNLVQSVHGGQDEKR